MRTRSETPAVVPAAAARRLFLHAQGLLDDPARPATAAALYKLVATMGAVQMDSIRVLERAHHLILAARLDGYRPHLLSRLLYRDRRLFEHWTHDAAAIPTVHFPYWRWRFEVSKRKIEASRWWRQRMGDDFEALCTHVLERIEREGPLQSRDFDHDRAGAPGGWWEWKPQKTALEYLWHTGTLAIADRVHFQKVYDLTERVLPEVAGLPAPARAEQIEWACRSALERLGVATPGEIAGFYHAGDPPTAGQWCMASAALGTVARVTVEPANGGRPVTCYAPADWARRLRRAPDPPPRIRVLAPFDPIVHDRRRTQRLFGFDYRFEAFVPAARRRHGYYVLPILEGDRLVGRMDPLPRKNGGRVQARRVWWEAGIRPTRARRRGLTAALERLTACIETAD